VRLWLPLSSLIPSYFWLLQHLSQGRANVSALQAEVTQAWEVDRAAEAARIMVVLAVETSAQEAATTRDSAMIFVKDVKDWAALAEREARERVSRVEADSTMVLVSTHEEAGGLAWKIALLKDELVEARWVGEVFDENFRGLSDTAADAERWWE
jgi:hypothetical protein